MAGNANSGNRQGRTDKPITDALRLAVKQNDNKALNNIVRSVVSQAQAGDQWAVQFITDRLEGKALQQIESHSINEYVFAEVPKTDTTDEWMKSPGAAVGASSQAHKPN